MAAQAKTTASAKISRPVTLKHLAATLAADHKLTKRQGEALLNDLVGLITEHLGAQRSKMRGFWGALTLHSGYGRTPVRS